MSIFDGLANDLAHYVGGLAVAQALLGIVLMVLIVVIIELLIGGKEGFGESGARIMMAWVCGFVFVVIIGYYPVWVPFLAGLVLLWLVLDPTGSRVAAAGGL
jgi:hypothetical protein